MLLGQRNTMGLSACLLLGPSALADVSTPAPAQTKPNIVVILVDDLGYGDLSSYGATDLQSPAIDSLVTRGLKFTRAYANCPVCSPTRAALLSGRYPELVGVPGVIRTHDPKSSWGYLSPDSVLLPAMLKKVGYQTAIVGKWHLGDRPEALPQAKGFDHAAVFLGDMMDDYYTHLRADINYMRYDGETVDPPGHATHVFTEWSIEYIRQCTQAPADHRRPFFLYLAYNAPHTPIQPPLEWIEKVKAREPNIADDRCKLVALIEHLDHNIGRVLDAIDEAGITDNTLIIFSSDNGGQLSVGANNGPTRGGKQDMYEGGIRVPQIAVWPHHIQAGTLTDQITLSMDIFPTCCDAAGVAIDHPIDGISILPTLLGQTQTIERDLFWTRREGGSRYMGQSVWLARSGDWKLLQNSIEGRFELFNIADDPQETTDLRDTQPDTYTELAVKLRAHMQRGGAVPWQPPDVRDRP